MKSETKEQETVRQYLLGQAPPEDSVQVEERLLADSAFYETLLIVEDELIDQYLTGEFSEPERIRFETHFMLAPERQQRLRFARALNKYVNVAGAAQPDEDLATAESSGALEVAESLPKERPFFSFLPFGNPIVSYSLAAAMLLIVGGVSWFILRSWAYPVPREPGKVFAAMLAPGLTRGDEEGTQISIPPGTDTLELQLQIASADQHQTYRALLQTTDGLEKFKANDLKPTTTGARAVVPLRLAAGLLTRGDYYVKLSGLTPRGEYEDVGRYSFRVVSE